MALLVSAMILFLLLIVLGVVRIKHELPPALAIVICILMILDVLIIYTIVLLSINPFDHDHSIETNSIITVLRIAFGFPALLLVYDLILMVNLYCSGNKMITVMQHLQNNASFFLVRIGAKRPKGYVIFSYHMDEETGFCSHECSICLMDYKEKDVCALLDKCGHTFHHICLHMCLNESTRCPLCRQNIKDCSQRELYM